jgi:hypothetical protein
MAIPGWLDAWRQLFEANDPSTPQEVRAKLDEGWVNEQSWVVLASRRRNHRRAILRARARQRQGSAEPSGVAALVSTNPAAGGRDAVPSAANTDMMKVTRDVSR